MTSAADPRSIQRLQRELARARERTEEAARRSADLESRLASLQAEIGRTAPSIVAFDPLPPSADRATLPELASGEENAKPAMPRPATPWWPTAEEAPPPLTPNAGWRNHALQGGGAKVIGVSVCGLNRDDLERTIALIGERQSATRDFVPVFLTDSTEFDLFRSYGYVFEYLPGAEKRAKISGTRPWDEYAAERRALLERKWRVDRVVVFGPAEFGRPETVSVAERPGAQQTQLPSPRAPHTTGSDSAAAGAPGVAPKKPARTAPAAAAREGRPRNHRKPSTRRKQPSVPSPYDPKAYWIARHGELKGDIRAVGNKGKSAEENEVLYARRNRQLRALLRREAQVRPLRHAVEFGCGIGMLAPAFVRSGLRYTGVDVSPVAIEAARARCPSGAFVEADIRDFEPPERADVVLVASVLCHMVEERDWRAVLARLSGALAPGGILILGEQLPRRVPIPYKDYVLHRTFEATRTALAEHGLILRRRGADLYSAGRPAEAGP